MIHINCNFRCLVRILDYLVLGVLIIQKVASSSVKLVNYMADDIGGSCYFS